MTDKDREIFFENLITKSLEEIQDYMVDNFSEVSEKGATILLADALERYMDKL